MFSLEKARRTLERWLFSADDTAAAPSAKLASEDRSAPPVESEARVHRFMDALTASSQEWLGRVRLISLDTIRDRLGARWPKLQGRVEILTEKVIEGELTAQDRYLNIGGGEFLVFFADATPEESRIRCLAIVESLRLKLFGTDAGAEALPAIAECHLVHRDEIDFAWQAKRVPTSQAPASLLRRPVRHDPEILNRSEIVLSSQNAIDSILGQALRSRAVAELDPLLLRLKYLCRGLKTLEPVLDATTRDGAARHRPAGAGRTPDPAGNAPARLFGAAWQDIVELISVLDAGDRGLEDRLDALTKLKQTRAERAECDPVPDGTLRGARPGDCGAVAYLPVYRSVGQGAKILQGIYRVEQPIAEWADCLAQRDDATDLVLRECAIRIERETLGHALDYLLERDHAGARFMLMVSVHVDSLHSPHSQMRYSMMLRSAQLRARRRLIIEVVGYRESDDTIAIRRAVEELRAHSHAVFLTLAPEEANFEKTAAQCKSLGAHALGLDVSRYGNAKPAAFDALKTLARAAEHHAIAWFVSGIGSIPVLAKAIAGGADYVSAPSLRPALASPHEMEAVTLDDLYATV